MQEVLIKKLHEYIGSHNPDLLLILQQEQQVTNYLGKKITSIDDLLKSLLAQQLPVYIIEERCMEILTADLLPSRYDYIHNILLEDFDKEYQRLHQDGILITEVVNMIQALESVFKELGFCEANEEDRFVRYAITGAIQEYFENAEVTEL